MRLQAYFLTLNGQTGTTQTFATGITGTDFAINSAANVHTFNLPVASAINTGKLSATDWSTFNAKVATSRTINTTSPITGGGDLSADRTIAINNAAADGATKGAATFLAADFDDNGSGLISIDYTNGQAASALTKGFLTAADWSLFNSKQAAGSYITALTGDVTAAGPGSVAATIANNAVTYAKIQDVSTTSKLLGSSSTTTPVQEITIGSGLTLTGTTLSASGSGGTVTSVASADGSITVTNPTSTVDLAVVQAPKLTTGRTISITGDLAYTSPSFDGTGNITAAGTLATVNADVGSFTNASITVNAKGLITAASSGTAPVTSVSGTANRITSTGGTTPVIDISAAYVGQTSITTLGTITTGVWNGTAIANANLANSTISGISLGNNLNTLTFGTHLTSGDPSYNGSANVTISTDASAVSGTSTLASRDGNGNIQTNNFVQGYTAGNATGSTTTLLASDSHTWYVTGSTTQIYKLPAVSTLSLGTQYWFHNMSTGNITIQSNNGSQIYVVPQYGSILLTSIATSGLGSGTWDAVYDGLGVASGKFLILNASLTLNGTDGTTITFPSVSSTLLYNGGPLGTPSSGTGTNLTGIPLTTGLTGGNWKTIYTDGSGVITELALPTAGKVLTGNGTTSAPTWETPTTGTVTSVSFTGGLISVATATTIPALTVAGTSGGIPYFSSTSTWASSGLLAANALMIGGGVGATPSTTATGTGVLTALGINIGSAGAFTTFDGAHGTPSSITLTNGTGLPVSTGISGLGTGVATFLGTPSWTNFNSMITGTAPFWSLATGGTLTGTNTITAGTNPLILSTGVTTGSGATAGFQIAANSLTTGNAVDISTSSITTGNLVALTSTFTTTAAAGGQKVLNILTSAPVVGLNISGTALSSASSSTAGANAANIITVVGTVGQAYSGSTVNRSGGLGAAVSITSGAGGANTGSGSGALTVGGQGGAITITSGAGGSTTGGSGSAMKGGQGGNLTFSSGVGGVGGGTGSGVGGNGGQFNFTGGVGGTSAVGAGGTGGLYAMTGGVGGISTLSTGVSGGGGGFTITGGVGGANSQASGITGAGGALTLNAGTAGAASGGATAGANGAITIGTTTALSITFGNTTDNTSIVFNTRTLFPAGTATALTAPIKLTTGTSMTVAEAGAFEYTTPQLFFTNGGAQRQEIPQIQQSRVSTQYDNTTVTLGNITGLTATVVAGKIYRFEATLYTTSNVAGGIKVAIGGTATATAIIYEGLVTDAGATTQGRSTTIGTAIAGVTAVTAAHVRIRGTITVNAAGTLTAQAAANVAVGTTSVLVGSTFVLTEMV